MSAVEAADVDMEDCCVDDEEDPNEEVMTEEDAIEFLRTNIPIRDEQQVAAGLKLLELQDDSDACNYSVIEKASKIMMRKFHPDKALVNGMGHDEALERTKDISCASRCLRGHAKYWERVTEDHAMALRNQVRETARMRANFPMLPDCTAELVYSWLSTIATDEPMVANTELLGKLFRNLRRQSLLLT